MIYHYVHYRSNLEGFPILDVLMFKSFTFGPWQKQPNQPASPRHTVRVAGVVAITLHVIVLNQAGQKMSELLSIATKKQRWDALHVCWDDIRNLRTKQKWRRKQSKISRGIVGSCSKHSLNWTCLPRSPDQLGRC